MTAPSPIADACRETAEVTREAVAWISDPANAASVGQEKTALVRELRRLDARAGRLARAAERPMCVGVFGPSQAGKSFLVSVLARPREGRLVARFDGRPEGADFISEINPEGEGESTGLVTRFTIRPYRHPANFPVRLRLLSEADVLRILANSFMLDGDLSEATPDSEEISGLLDKHGNSRGGAPAGGLRIAHLWETQAYFEKQFGRIAYAEALKSFWEEAAEIAPALPLAERARFLSILWGRHEPFTDLYVKLVGALEQLGFPEEGFCGLDALIPREVSIIDVKTLEGLDGGDTTPLTVKSAAGPEASLPRCLVTALTAELQILMDEQPWDLFEHTDLLDFPGARSRFKKELKAYFDDAEAPLKETFLRGKVAYLFDRYVAEQELTSMLLCVPDSNMEVADLPGLVDDWIAHTHGSSPAERAGSTCILFFVLTKFDKHLVDSAGSGDDPSARFSRRIESSLLGPFGGLKDSWPNNWAGQGPFDNCYWLRNPNYPAEAVIRYENDREVEFLEHKRERIDQLEQGCLAVAEVNRHFREPKRAWDAAMALNDGGVGYLVENLTPVCQPHIKDTQVAGQLAHLRETLRQRLARFHVSDDAEQRLEERRAVADEVVGAVYGALDGGRFGRLLKALMVEPAMLTDRLFRMPSDVRIVIAPSERAARPSPGRPSPGRPSPGRPSPARPSPARPSPASTRPEATSGPAAGEPKVMTREQHLANESLRFWLEAMHEVADDESAALRYAIEPKWLGEIVTELAAGSRRLNLAERLTEEVKRFSFLDRTEMQAAKPALIASQLLNNFVNYLGFDAVPEAERPKVKLENGERPVFAARETHDDASGLGAEPVPFAELFATDWVFALYRLFEDNAKSEQGGLVDPEQNARMGALLARIETA